MNWKHSRKDMESVKMRFGAAWRLLLAATMLCLTQTGMSQTQGGEEILAASHADFGSYLTDAAGMSLYAFSEDSNGQPTCTEACAELWPPVITGTEDVTAGPGVAPTLLAVVERPDGTLQLAYNSLPLYRHALDSAPGDTGGQAIAESWYLVSPFGAAIVPKAQPAPIAVAPVEANDLAQEELDALLTDGASLFASSCAACHGERGQGASGPALSGRDLGNDRAVIRQILRGSGFMPGFATMMDDPQISAVTTFIRQSWGNDFRPVTSEEVIQYR